MRDFLVLLESWIFFIGQSSLVGLADSDDGIIIEFSRSLLSTHIVYLLHYMDHGTKFILRLKRPTYYLYLIVLYHIAFRIILFETLFEVLTPSLHPAAKKATQIHESVCLKHRLFPNNNSRSGRTHDNHLIHIGMHINILFMDYFWSQSVDFYVLVGSRVIIKYV